LRGTGFAGANLPAEWEEILGATGSFGGWFHRDDVDAFGAGFQVWSVAVGTGTLTLFLATTHNGAVLDHKAFGVRQLSSFKLPGGVSRPASYLRDAEQGVISR
jgi:hypothetical protein